jgi:putative MFS transporter
MDTEKKRKETFLKSYAEERTVRTGVAGKRLDSVDPGPFHRRLVALIGAGMFLDGFDVYMAGGVLGAMVQQGTSTLALNADFIAATFAGMLVGAVVAGFVGDRFGRRASYQANLLLFGSASLAGAFAPTMPLLIALRFLMGIGLGAEIVVGYAMLTEFMPAHVRGRWSAMLAMLGNTGLLVSSLVGYLVIPSLGWRWMFGLAGAGALYVWYLRKSMPESPRWLEAVGRYDEADAVLRMIEAQSGASHRACKTEESTPPLRVGVSRTGPTRRQMTLGIVINVVVSTVLYGYVSWIPTFLAKQGVSVSSSLGYVLVMSLGGPIGAWLAYVTSDRIGRKRSVLLAAALTIVIGSAFGATRTPVLVMLGGLCLFSSVYFLLSATTATYVPELFETKWRLRSVGICSMAGRLGTVISPFLVVYAFNSAGFIGVVGFLDVALAALVLCMLMIGIETQGVSLEAVESAVTRNSGSIARDDVMETR